MEQPTLPDDLLALLADELSEDEAPFLAHLESCLSLEWLEPDSDVLGNTHFEMTHNDLDRRRRFRMPPGPVTIGLHPRLAEDAALQRHTLLHELLHAAGLTDHDSRHREVLTELAPPPKLSESPVLQDLRAEVLARAPKKEWACAECGHAWERKTVSRPESCPMCERPL